MKTIEYKCKYCNRFYKSQMSFYNHNKKFHSGIISSTRGDKNTKITISLPENSSENTCKYCDKTLSCKRSLSRHHLICKNKQNIILENEQLNNSIKESDEIYRKNIDELKNMISLLQMQLA
jgi:hypothetical protein